MCCFFEGDKECDIKENKEGNWVGKNKIMVKRIVIFYNLLFIDLR